MAGKVGDYVNARANAFASNVQEVAQRVQSNGIIETALELGLSALGVLPANSLGKDFADRRAQARKILTGI